MCNCKSSTDEWCVIEYQSIIVDKRIMFKEKSIGSGTKPCGALELTDAKAEQ